LAQAILAQGILAQVHGETPAHTLLAPCYLPLVTR